jgi:hypothetical protein
VPRDPGTSIAKVPEPAHDDTTKRPAPGKTLFDPAPYGASLAAAEPVSKHPTPLVPGPPDEKQDLKQTIVDPEAESRAASIRDQALAAALEKAQGASSPAVPEQKPLSVAADRPLGRTLVLGGDPPGGAGSPSAPTPARPEPSPLSRSVMAPSSRPPPPPPEPVQTTSNERPAAKTMIGTASPFAQPPAPAFAQPPAPAPAPPPAPAQPSAVPNHARTMLGMPATNLPQASAAPVDPARLPPAQKTMLGVAMPGIAPSHSNAPADPSMLKSEKSTMLGVAVPGIAPIHGGRAPAPMPERRPPPQIVPAPAPLALEPIPEGPMIPQKRGVPVLAVIAMLIGVTIVLGGVGAFVALRGGGPLTAQPQLDEAGHESLKLGCPTCPDGTEVSLGTSKATVQTGSAVLQLPAPLSIGDNDLTLKIDRPGAGRDEDVKIHVPVAYRVRADLTTLAAKPPAITVRVEAVPGSEAIVDGKPLALDAQGHGAYAIELGADAEGTANESKTFERKIPFTITPKGGQAETGSLGARTSIVPLHLDAPGQILYTDKTTAPIAGQAPPGATVTVDGAAAPVDAQGKFAARMDLAAATGEKTIAIVASSPPLAPRTVHAKIVRVASLEDAAKDLAGQSPIAYDAFGADPNASAGKNAIVEGEVVDARSGPGHTVLLVDEKKACSKGTTCLVRIVHGEDDKLARGDTVRAFGRVIGAVSANGKTVPDIEASLVLPVKAGK